MRRSSLVVVTALIAVANLAVAGEESPLDEADRRAFAWFDEVGFPSCVGRQYVRASVKDSRVPGRSEPVVVGGFLLSETDESWMILCDDLWSVEVPRREEEVSAELSRIDLRKRAAEVLAGVRVPVGPEETGTAEFHRGLHPLGGTVGMRSILLGLARHLAENGDEADAHALLVEARRLGLSEVWGGGCSPLGAEEEGQLGAARIWRLVLDCGETRLSRPLLLAGFRGWSRSFPHSEHRPIAEEATRVLTKMVEEDAEHERLSDRQIAALPADGRAREWIFRLRDQHGGQGMQPGSPSIFLSEEAEDAASPARRLEEMGYDAVPALIEALDDQRYTRTVGFHRNFAFSHYVVRVGDAALELLIDITGRRFWELLHKDAGEFLDEKGRSVKERYRSWWRDVKGFLPPLRGLAAETDPARRRELARALPDRGPGLIVGAPPEALWGTGRIVEGLPGLGAEGTKELLRVVLAESPFPRTRSLAAWALLDLGDRSGVTAMATLWDSMEAATRTDPVRGGAVASFLASCGDVAGVQALAKGLDQQPPGVREMVVLAFGDRGFGAVRGLAGDDSGGMEEPWKLEGAAARGAERIVAGRLENLEQDPLDRIRPQLQAQFDRRFDAGRRICDAAIRILGLRWKDAYPYRESPFPTAEEWERVRKQFLETWRARSRDQGPR